AHGRRNTLRAWSPHDRRGHDSAYACRCLLDLDRRPPPLDAKARAGRLRYHHRAGNPGRDNGAETAAARGIDGPCRGRPDFLLYCRNHRGLHQPALDRRAAARRIRLPPAQPRHTNPAFDFCSLRSADPGRHVPAPWHELVAACFECGDRGAGADLDCRPRPVALLTDPSREEAFHPHAHPADYEIVTRLSNLSYQGCVGSGRRSARIAHGFLNRGPRRDRSTPVGNDCDPSHPSLEARAGLLRRTRARRRRKTVNRMRSYTPNTKPCLLYNTLWPSKPLRTNLPSQGRNLPRAAP